MRISKYTMLLISLILIITGCGGTTAAPLDSSFSEIEFTLEEDKMIIETFEIGTEYTIIDADTGIKHQPADQTAIKDLLGIPGLVGYDNEYIYISYHDNNELLFSKVNYKSKYIERGIYRTNANIAAYDHVKNDFLYIWESGEQDGELSGKLKRININTDIGQPSVEVIFQNASSRLPDVRYHEEYITINYKEKDDWIIGYMSYDDVQYVEVSREAYKLDDEARYTGEIPLYGSIIEDDMYYQVVTLVDEMLDFEGTPALYHYSLKEKKKKRVLNLSDKIVYVNGNKNFIILSYYSVNNPQKLTGRIISLVNNSIVTVPYIFPGEDIRSSVINENLIFITSLEYIYVYDYEKQTYSYMDLRAKPFTLRNSLLKFFESSFGRLETSDDKILMKIIRYEV